MVPMNINDSNKIQFLKLLQSNIQCLEMYFPIAPQFLQLSICICVHRLSAICLPQPLHLLCFSASVQLSFALFLKSAFTYQLLKLFGTQFV